MSNWGKVNQSFYNSSFFFNMIFFYPMLHKNIYLVDPSTVTELKKEEKIFEESLVGKEEIKAFLEKNLENYTKDSPMRKIYEIFSLKSEKISTSY